MAEHISSQLWIVGNAHVVTRQAMKKYPGDAPGDNIKIDGFLLKIPPESDGLLEAYRGRATRGYSYLKVLLLHTCGFILIQSMAMVHSYTVNGCRWFVGNLPTSNLPTLGCASLSGGGALPPCELGPLGVAW